MNTDRKIATLILPLHGNEGKKLTKVHRDLRDAILAVWGGYTQTLVTGAWKDEKGDVYQDDSLKYEIAMTTGAGDGKKLVEIAARACLAGKQQCVFVQLAAGNVVFVNAS